MFVVLDVLRIKCQESEFRARVKSLAEHWGAQFVTGYIAATEQPNIDMLQVDGVPAFGRRAVSDKKVRALPSAAGWNIGRIRVRDAQFWTRDFVSEVQGFTGSDRHDDQVDALAAVYDAMFVGAAVDWDFMDELAARAPKTHADWIGPHAGLN
jgi:predicted phage terminase large subunit-like protein